MYIIPICNRLNTFKYNKNLPSFCSKYSGWQNNSIITSEITEKPQRYKRNTDSSIYFQTSEQYEKLLKKQYSSFPEDIKFYEEIRKHLQDLDIDIVLNKLENCSMSERNIVMKSPDFTLNLATLPICDKNKQVYQKLLKMLEETSSINLDVKDNFGVTLLEKIIVAENNTYLQTMKNILSNRKSNNFLLYNNMQEFAYNQIHNPEFKENCKNLPIKFPNIESAIKNRNLQDLAKHLPEMRCGFCDINLAVKQCLSGISDKDYLHIVENMIKKSLPRELITSKIKHLIF